MGLVQSLLQGDRKALSRLVSLVESDPQKMTQIMGEIYQHAGKAFLLGITGPPGSGKSSLVDKLIDKFRRKKLQVGVIAIDPSSPFSGGALLGDRIRMTSHATDKGVFIRSLGSRGSHGGISKSTKEVVRLYDAAGFDVVVIETVGVGQTELDIMEIADTTIVMLVPESGDTVQTMKAGLMEIADIFLVNKADRDGADALVTELKEMVNMAPKKRGGWVPPILKTKAHMGEGVDELLDIVDKHKEYRASNPEEEERIKTVRRLELLEILLDEFRARIESGMDKGTLKPIFDEVATGKSNPYTAALKILSSGDLYPFLFDQSVD